MELVILKSKFKQNNFQDLKGCKIQLSDIYKLSRQLTKEISNQKKIDESVNQNKKILQKILEYIIASIEGNIKLTNKNFISLFSILSYINVALSTSSFIYQLKINEEFYSNLQYYASKVVQEWKSIQQPSIRNIIKINLSTLLCSISSIITESKKTILDLNLEKILAPQTIKILLNAEYPNQEKFMKHYKVLINYLYNISSVNDNLQNITKQAKKQKKMKFSAVSKQIFIKSLIYHLINCPLLRSTQMTIIYILSKQFQDKKIVNKIPQILFQLKDICPKMVKCCFSILLETQEEKLKQQKLILEFLAKFLDKIPLIQVDQLKGQQVLDVISFVNENKNKYREIMQAGEYQKLFPEKIQTCFQKIIMKMQQVQRLYIFQQITNSRLFNIQGNANTKNRSQQQQKIASQIVLNLQLIQLSTKNISQDFIIYILETGLWEKFIKIFQNQNKFTYKKFLITKVVSNILKSCEKVNGDFCSILRGLFEHNHIFCYAGSFE